MVSKSLSLFCVKSTSWRQKVCHDVKKFARKLKRRHDVRNSISWRQKVWHDVRTCHNVKTFVRKSKTIHDIKKFIMTSKHLSWSQKHVLTSKVYHDVKNTSKSLSWRQKHFMTSQKSLWWHQKHVISITLTLTFDLFPWYFVVRIIPGYLHIKFCNNRPTFNEVMVWYRAADTQIHTYRHTETPALQ